MSALSTNRTVALLLYIANKAKWIVALILVDYFASAYAYSRFEEKGIGLSLWWAVVTGQTVGYGDMFPKTIAGRLIAVWLMVSMSLLWAVLTASITIRLVIAADLFSHDEQERIKTAAVRDNIASGSLPSCMETLPPADWTPYLDHPTDCGCGWTVPERLVDFYRRVEEKRLQTAAAAG